MQLHNKFSDDTPTPNKDLLTIKPYVQGKSVIPEFNDPVKLSSNESSHGPGPKTIEAFHSVADTLFRYTDGSQMELRQAIADVHGLDTEKIICGNGSEELIGLAVRSYVKPDTELLLSENHFIMCPIYGKAQSADVIYAREREYTIQVDEVLKCITEKTRMIIIANPNNPTGTYLPGSEVKRLHANIPAHVLLIMDEAYGEYVTKQDYESALSMVEEHDNIIVTRTFSKIYGLAGLRIGWAYCPEPVVDVIQRIRTPFNTNCAALASATAAIRDTEYINKIREHNAYWLEKINNELNEMGLNVIPGVANFYLISFSDLVDKSAVEAASFLESKGIIPRPTGSNDDTLRITVGLDHENEAVIKVLKDYMEKK